MTYNYRTMTALLSIAMLGLLCAAACAAPASPATSQPPPVELEAPAAEPLPNYPAPPRTEAPPVAPPAIDEVQTGEGVDKECCPPLTPWPDRPYLEYEAKPFVDTRDDHLSTFAMDVDTASYTKMREYINSDRLPPADLVRVEEFITLFLIK